MKRFFIILLFVNSTLVFSQTETETPSKSRKYSNEFLNIGVDASAMAMGNTVTSTVSDVTAGYWNPAGLAHVKGYQGSLMHASYFANIAQYDYAAFAMPIQEKGAIGISLLRFGVDDILDTTKLIDANGNINYDNIKLFSAADYAMLLSYAHRNLFDKNLNVGVTTKIIHRRIGEFASSFGFGLDAGLQYKNTKWQYGLMLRDITTTFNTWNINEDKFEDIRNAIPGENQELPETTEITLPKAQFGIARDWVVNDKIDLLTNLEMNVRFAQTNAILNTKFASFEPAFGMQLDYADMVFLRAGVNNLQNEILYDETETISWQPNISVGFNYKGFQIDYALTNISGVGNVTYSNIFSLKFDFNAYKKE